MRNGEEGRNRRGKRETSKGENGRARWTRGISAKGGIGKRQRGKKENEGMV